MQRDTVRAFGGVVAIAIGLAAPVAQSAQRYWNTAGAGNWTDATKWNETVTPFSTGNVLAGEVVFIDQGNVTIDSAIAAPGNIRMGFGGLTGPTPGNGTTGTLTIAAGASLTYSSDLRIGEFAGKSGTVVQTGGTLSKTGGQLHMGAAGTGTYLLQGGTLSVSSTWFTIAKDAGSSGSFRQSGGTFNVGAGSTLAFNNGLFEISGGALNIGDSSVNAYIDTTGTTGTFRVKGSAATLNVRTMAGGTTNKFEFMLDNSAGHISTINGSAGYTAFNRRGNLKIALDGGILLAGASQFDVIKVDGFGGNDFASRPTAGTSLWSSATVNDVDGTKDVERITLENNKGTVAFGGAIGVAASNYGHVSLTGVPLTDPLLVSLDLTGGTLANVTNALTAAGISWAAGSGAYEVALTLSPAVSGGTRFAWDFSSIDPAMTVQGVSLSAVPEPTSIAMFMIPAAMMLRRRMRK